MVNGVIYKLENPTGKIYIGKSVDFSSRLSAYRNLKCETQRALYNSLKKYGLNQHTITILYEGPSDTLHEKEIFYIEEYKSFKPDNPKGLNLTKGGEGQLGNKQSSETIQKRIQVHIGAKRTDDTKKLMSDSAKLRKPNFTGKKHSQSTIEKMSLVKRGKIQQDSTIMQRQSTMKTNRLEKFGNILQLTLQGELIKEWEPSYVFIAKEMGCDPTTIRSAVRSNGEKVRLGYKWKFSKNESI